MRVCDSRVALLSMQRAESFSLYRFACTESFRLANLFVLSGRPVRRGRRRNRRGQAVSALRAHTYSAYVLEIHPSPVARIYTLKHFCSSRVLLFNKSYELLIHPFCFTERNGRKTLTTVQGLPKKFDQKKILRVIKKKFACNGNIVDDTEMGEVIQLQGDQRKDVQEFLMDKKEGLGLDGKTIKVCSQQLRKIFFPLLTSFSFFLAFQVHGF